MSLPNCMKCPDPDCKLMIDALKVKETEKGKTWECARECMVFDMSISETHEGAEELEEVYGD